MDPLTLTLVCVGLVLAAGITAGSIYMGRATKGDRLQEAAAKKAAWDAFRTRHRIVSGDPSKLEDTEMQIASGDVTVRVDSYQMKSGDSTVYWTRVRAVYAFGSGPAFKLRPEGIFETAGDVRVGGQRFDDAFIVEARDAAAVKAVWSQVAMDLMMGPHVTSVASANETEVTLQWQDAPEVGPLESGIRLVAELARMSDRGKSWIAAMESMPGARVERRGGSVPRAFFDGPGGAVEIAPSIVEGVSLLQATAEVRGETFGELRARIPDETASLPAALRSHVAFGELTRAAPCVLVSSAQTIACEWDGEVTAARLEAGSRFLAACAAGPSAGAFR